MLQATLSSHSGTRLSSQHGASTLCIKVHFHFNSDNLKMSPICRRRKSHEKQLMKVFKYCHSIELSLYFIKGL